MKWLFQETAFFTKKASITCIRYEKIGNLLKWVVGLIGKNQEIEWQKCASVGRKIGGFPDASNMSSLWIDSLQK